MIKKKQYTKEKIKDSTHIGILICSLSIRDLLECINRVKCLCKKTNKKCYIFSVGRPNIAKLANFPEVIFNTNLFNIVIVNNFILMIKFAMTIYLYVYLD